MNETRTDYESRMNRLCSRCGLTWGSHRCDAHNETCPGHEGRMDWENGPGSVFHDSGEVAEIVRGTPARGRGTRAGVAEPALSSEVASG